MMLGEWGGHKAWRFKLMGACWHRWRFVEISGRHLSRRVRIRRPELVLGPNLIAKHC